jgi:hypothetical protein
MSHIQLVTNNGVQSDGQAHVHTFTWLRESILKQKSQLFISSESTYMYSQQNCGNTHPFSTFFIIALNFLRRPRVTTILGCVCTNEHANHAPINTNLSRKHSYILFVFTCLKLGLQNLQHQNIQKSSALCLLV